MKNFSVKVKFEKCEECLNRYFSEGVEMCFSEDDLLKNCDPESCEDMRYLED